MPVFLVRKNSPFANILILVNPVLSAIFIVARSSSLEGAYINGTLSIDLTPGNWNFCILLFTVLTRSISFHCGVLEHMQQKLTQY